MSAIRDLNKCRRCGKRMRPRDKTLADYPNTVRFGSEYLCDQHTYRAVSHGLTAGTMISTAYPVTPDQVRTVIAAVERRARSAEELADMLGALGIAS